MIIGYHGQPEKGTFGNKRHFYQNRDRFTRITVRDDKHNWIPAHHAHSVMSGMTVLSITVSPIHRFVPKEQAASLCV
jgi:hypothetical protein